MIKGRIVIAAGVLVVIAGLVMAALISTPAQAGDPVPGLDITIEQIPGWAVIGNIAAQLGTVDAFTVELRKTSLMQLGLARKLTEEADRLAASGDLKLAADFAIMAAELEQRVILKLKAAASTTELYTRAISHRIQVVEETGALFTKNYNSSKSNTSLAIVEQERTGGLSGAIKEEGSN